MHVVWFSWKDEEHPQAGGAETVSSRIRRNLVKDGHAVTLITASYPGGKPDSDLSGVRVLRAGGRYTVYLKARSLYKELLKSQPIDLVVDEMNTIPFWAARYTGDVPTLLLTYQLARRVWFYQIPLPLSAIGYILEPLYLRVMSRSYDTIATESDSTKNDLSKYGFSSKDISTFRVGMETKPLSRLGPKPKTGKVLFLGAMRPMKRPLEAVKAFECAKDRDPGLSLRLAGDTSGRYAKKVLRYIEKSRYRDSITVLGRVAGKDKVQLLQASDIILVTSVKEGWGLVVTEANSQGTPAVAFDADGLRDSVVNRETGLLVPNGDYQKMGEVICELRQDDAKYKYLRKTGYGYSKQYTFANSYRDFKTIIEKAVGEKEKN